MEIKKLEEAIEKNKGDSILNSLAIHNFGSPVSELYELQRPYGLIYEAMERKTDKFILMEFGPGIYNHHTAKIKELQKIDKRTLHKHDYFEMMIVLSGSVSQHIENKSHVYTQGQCCVLNRNIRHCEAFEADCEVLFIMLSDEFIKNMIEQDIQYSTDGTFHNAFGAIYHLIKQNQQRKYYEAKEYIDFTPFCGPEGSSMPELLHLINQIIEEIIGQKPGSIFIVEGLIARLCALFEETQKYTKTCVSLSSNKEEQLLGSIVKLLDECHGRISRSELETRLNYNGDYLNRIVKKYTGMTLVAYGQIFCLKEAKRLLLQSDYSITEIVHQLGFSNRSYFYKVFFKQYKMTPKEYRDGCLANKSSIL